MSKNILLSAIKADPQLSPRRKQGTDKDVVAQYMECFDQLPPIIVYHIDGQKKYLLVDGWHRYGAAVNLGLESIKADVKYGTLDDAREFAFLANIRHGLPLITEDRRWVLEQFIKLHPERSNAWIASDIGVSKNTVSGIRERLESGCQIDTLTELVGRDGKTYPRNIIQPQPELPALEPVEEVEELEVVPEEPEVSRLGPYALDAIHQNDCVQALMELPADSIDLVVTDPPYNIGVQYGEQMSDSLPDEEYYRWCNLWFMGVYRVLKPGGAFYVMHYPEVAARWTVQLNGLFTFRRWLSWVYPSNIGHSRQNWSRSHRTILYYVKRGADSYFDGQADPQEYKNPNDIRIKHLPTNGTTPYDWWEYNLVKNVSKDKSSWPNQIPTALVYRIIATSCPPDGIVLDPFMGSGTMADAAIGANRTWLGFDIHEEACAITRGRIENVRANMGAEARQLQSLV